jgi:lactate dehydrogenase-like 2-hydroxyacid dehydrogenase
MKPDVLALCALGAQAMAQVEATYTVHRYDLATDKAAMLNEVGAKCRAIMASGHVTVDCALIDKLPNLGVVACSSAGYDTIDVETLSARGIPLTNTSAALLDDVADTAIMLLLATRRDLIRAHGYTASGAWARDGMYPLQTSIRGKRLGIVGMGQIGQAIAARCAPMGLEVAYFGRRAKPEMSVPFFGNLVDLATWADILVLAIAGGPATQNLVDAPMLHALGPTGTLINVARGTVVDEAALIAALRDGHLGNAGLDVFLNEPMVDPALTNLPNVTLYPHHASGTVETRDMMFQLVVDNLAAFYAGTPLLTPVN